MARTATFYVLVSGILSGTYLAHVAVETTQSSGQLDAANAVSFYVANADLSQWSTVEAAFRSELVNQAEVFCSHGLEECNVNPNTGLSLSEDNVVFFTGFPAEVDNNLRVIVGIGLTPEQAFSPPAFIPQAQLMNIMLINQASLHTAVGSLIGQITLYYEEPIPSPSPTTLPSAPALDIIIEYAILIIVDQASLTQWQEGTLEQLFREAVAEVANDHCASSLASCNIEDSVTKRRKRSKDPLFYESSTYIVPDYPREVSDSQLEIAFAVTLPSSVTLVSGVVDYFIPQSTLLSLGLELSPVLAELSGAYIIGMSAYKPTDLPITASLWSQIGVQVTVPSVLLGLIGIILLIGLPAIWLRGKRHKELYSVDNYVGGASKQVEMVNYHHLTGVWSPVESEDEHPPQQCTGEGEEFSNQEECHAEEFSNQEECHAEEFSNQEECHGEEFSNQEECHAEEFSNQEECHAEEFSNQEECHGEEFSNQEECHAEEFSNQEECHAEEFSNQEECHGEEFSNQEECHGLTQEEYCDQSSNMRSEDGIELQSSISVSGDNAGVC